MAVRDPHVAFLNQFRTVSFGVILECRDDILVLQELRRSGDELSIASFKLPGLVLVVGSRIEVPKSDIFNEIGVFCVSYFNDGFIVPRPGMKFVFWIRNQVNVGGTVERELEEEYRFCFRNLVVDDGNYPELSSYYRYCSFRFLFAEKVAKSLRMIKVGRELSDIELSMDQQAWKYFREVLINFCFVEQTKKRNLLVLLRTIYLLRVTKRNKTSKFLFFLHIKQNIQMKD